MHVYAKLMQCSQVSWARAMDRYHDALIFVGRDRVGADLENGIYGGPYVNDTALRSDFVTAMIKGRTDGFATIAGDARSGGLKTYYDGPRPKKYQPMHKTGAIILGVGGDNVNRRAHRLATSSQVGAKVRLKRHTFVLCSCAMKRLH